MLRFLQQQLRKLWTDELYSEEFRARKSSYKDFDHALKHVRKAAQTLENMTEEADHSGSLQVFEAAALKKYIADILISTVRLANTTPLGVVDLEQSVLERIERKMGVRLSGKTAKADGFLHYDKDDKWILSGEGPNDGCRISDFLLDFDQKKVRVTVEVIEPEES